MHGFPLLAVAVSGGRRHCVFLALSLHWAPSVMVSFHPALRPLVVVACVCVHVRVRVWVRVHARGCMCVCASVGVCVCVRVCVCVCGGVHGGLCVVLHVAPRVSGICL